MIAWGGKQLTDEELDELYEEWIATGGDKGLTRAEEANALAIILGGIVVIAVSAGFWYGIIKAVAWWAK